MLRLLIISAVVGLSSTLAWADGIELKNRRVPVYRAVKERVFVVPPCYQVNPPVLLACAPRAISSDPVALVFQKALVVRPRTPYPRLSRWPSGQSL